MIDGMESKKLEGNMELFTVYSINDETHDYIGNIMDEHEKDGYVKYIFNLQHIKFVNSHFIGLLAKRHLDLTKKGGRIVLLNASDIVKKMFTIFGLEDTFQFHTDLEKAVNSFKELNGNFRN